MMTKITNRSALIFVTMGLLSLSFLRPAFSAQKAVSIDITVPAQSLDFSDLDVRDEFNRPVKNAGAARAFATTVQSLLCKSLIENLTPNNRFIQNILSLKFDVVCGWIKRGVQKASEKIQSAILSAKKWFVFLASSKAATVVAAPDHKVRFSHNNFFFLISSLLSSTQILR